MAKKRRSTPPRNGRMRWEGNQTRMWDRQDREFEWLRDVERDEARALLSRDDVAVAIYSGTRSLRWIEPPDRARTWSDELASNLHDDPNWRAPQGSRGTRPYVPEVWREVNGNALVLLFNDHE